LVRFRGWKSILLQRAGGRSPLRTGLPTRVAGVMLGGGSLTHAGGIGQRESRIGVRPARRRRWPGRSGPRRESGRRWWGEGESRGASGGRGSVNSTRGLAAEDGSVSEVYDWARAARGWTSKRARSSRLMVSRCAAAWGRGSKVGPNS